MSTPDSLETAMSRVLSALAENHAATGGDEWEGKPAQEPLPAPTEGSEIELVPGDDGSELNTLMHTYIGAAQALRKASEPDSQESTDTVAQKPAVSGPTKYDQMSLAELMGELDAVTV